MQRSDPLRRLALVGCLLCAGLLTVYTFAPGFNGPPLPLYAIFTGVWLFGALMLWTFPLFGAAGTALYSVLMGAQLLAAHEARGQNVLLALLSFATAAVAVGCLVQRRRERA